MPVGAVVRPLVTAGLLLTAYYLLPVDRRLTGWHAAGLIAGLCLVIAVVAWQVRLISRAKYPALQGVQALALSVPLFLLLFANTYYLLSHTLPPSFTEPLTRTDALYFTVTVFATVGFGDIAPVSQAARVLVTVQMVGNLLVLGAALRVIVTAVQRRRRQE
ncbi:potassium channel family protein [Amycolatopsis sp. 195334CR]|uniref:potassium channel family protein n=1 Tax=Amycolatopsis sp. 195334CR TaxID=2814588 RepID=UPI001A8CC659|nr:potassium channel family protein [Amycolatopsis sp. 195334CR]MBN6040591.1 two pore domain potassium channel family protein [Amycolatopsis sp. 195334CR]